MPAKVSIFSGFPTFFIFWDHFCESSRTVEKIFDQKVGGGVSWLDSEMLFSCDILDLH